MSMSPEELQQLIAGYVLYTLSPEEVATLEQLMRTNPTILKEVELMQKALELTFMPSEAQPPEQLRSQILNLARQTALPQSQQPSAASPVPDATVSNPTIPGPSPIPVFESPSPSRQTQRRSWVIGLGAIAASLIVGLSISNYALWRSLQLARSQLQPSEAVVVALEPTAEDSPVAATVALDPANLQATLNIENLPPLPAGQVYVLWTVLEADAPFTTDAKNAILTETFTVSDQETQSQQIALPPVYRDRQWIKAIAITVEAAEAPQRHEASPILIQML
ncbi:MAG: anti-sigma factor domain-containing protein [Thainema sp.]